MSMSFRDSWARRSSQNVILLNILTVLVYIVGVQISYQFVNSELSEHTIPLWLPPAFTLGLFFHFEYRILPGMILGAILGAIVVLNHFSPPLSVPPFLFLTLTFAFANTIQPILANLWLKNRLTQKSPKNSPLVSPNPAFSGPSVINPFTTVKTTLFFIRVAILTPLLSACFGTLCLGVTSLLRPDQLLLVFITWWLANALANLVFSPVFILVRFEKWSLLKTKKVELGIVLFFLILVNILTFVSNYPVAYLYLPLILITVCHLGGFVANVVVSLATLIALFFTGQGHGVFLQIFQIQPLIFLQSFTGILSLTALLFAALTQEREQARKALTQMIDSLENQVKCRTCELQVAQQKLQFANQELEKLVNLDALTQVANRRWFDRTLEQEWYRLLREQKPLSLLMLDIDYFKAYNDFYGHPQGDSCLHQVAQVLTQAAGRSADGVARYGGEEFAILLPSTDLIGAIAIAEKIQCTLAHLRLAHRASPLQPTLTVSIGITCLIPTPPHPPKTLVQQADQALYQAKRQGRNQYKTFCSSDPVTEAKD